jgi:hypothetical protein
MPTLSDTLAIERDRCSLLARDFNQIGSAGAFGAALLREAVGLADAAVRTGETDSMHRALVALQRYTELSPNADTAQAAVGMVPRSPRTPAPRPALCAPAQRYLQAA